MTNFTLQLSLNIASVVIMHTSTLNRYLRGESASEGESVMLNPGSYRATDTSQ